MPFARKMVDLLEEMKATAAGCPSVPAEIPEALRCITEWSEKVSSEDWQFADFAALYQYLRGNRHLQIPQTWRGTIPDRLG